MCVDQRHPGCSVWRPTVRSPSSSCRSTTPSTSIVVSGSRKLLKYGDATELNLPTQAVEAEEVVLDREDLDRLEPGPARELADGRLAQHRARRLRRLIDHRRGQAVRDAPAVHHALELVARSGERVRDTFVGEEHGAAL